RIKQAHDCAGPEGIVQSGEQARRDAPDRQSRASAGSEPDQRESRADRESLRPLPERKHRRSIAVDIGKTRTKGPYRDARLAAGDVALRAAVERDPGRF